MAASGCTVRISTSSPASTSAMRALTNPASLRCTGRISHSNEHSPATVQRASPPVTTPTLVVVWAGSKRLSAGARDASSPARPSSPPIQRVAWCTAFTASAGRELCPSMPVTVVVYS